MAAVTICSDFGAQKIKSDTVSTASPSISHEVMGPDAHHLWRLGGEKSVRESVRKALVYLVESTSLRPDSTGSSSDCHLGLPALGKLL